jgi:hypothetical protein
MTPEDATELQWAATACPIEVRSAGSKGRGVFARRYIATGEIVEVSEGALCFIAASRKRAGHRDRGGAARLKQNFFLRLLPHLVTPAASCLNPPHQAP